MESIHQLSEGRLISQLIVKQLLQLVEDCPKEADRIVKGLKSISDGSGIDVIKWIESFYQEAPEHSRNQDTESLEESPAARNEGTMELEDLFEAGEAVGVREEKSLKAQEEEDIELARRMQEQFNKEDKQAGEEEEVPCEICYVNLFEAAVETLECGHIFHKNCLVESFKNNISTNAFPIRCPSDDCKREASEGDLRVILSREMFDKYQKHTLKAYADEHGDSISWCPTANCGYMFFFEKEDEERFECLECRKEYCLNCRVEWHKDMTCKEYKISSTTSEDDEKFISFVKGKKFKQCPKCKFWVEKNEGCDHMTCKCKFEFCYKCGGVYMKCECVEKAREEMEHRRRANEERMRKKMERKAELAEKRVSREEKKRQV